MTILTLILSGSLSQAHTIDCKGRLVDDFGKDAGKVSLALNIGEAEASVTGLSKSASVINRIHSSGRAGFIDFDGENAESHFTVTLPQTGLDEAGRAQKAYLLISSKDASNVFDGYLVCSARQTL